MSTADKNTEYVRLIILGYAKHEAYAKAYGDLSHERELPVTLRTQAI